MCNLNKWLSLGDLEEETVIKGSQRLKWRCPKSVGNHLNNGCQVARISHSVQKLCSHIMWLIPTLLMSSSFPVNLLLSYCFSLLQYYHHSHTEFVCMRKVLSFLIFALHKCVEDNNDYEVKIKTVKINNEKNVFMVQCHN